MRQDDQMISLRTPAEPRSVSIVRAVAANVAAATDVSFEIVDDLRLAVAEACNRLMAIYPRADHLFLDTRVEGRTVELRVSVDGGQAEGSSEDAVMPWRIIEALTERAEERTIEGHPSIVMHVSMVPANS
jgi:hypothetical protein